MRQGWLRDVRISGRSILTTGEHPFYVLGHGWKRAVELQVGDQVTSHTGQWLPIEANDSTGKNDRHDGESVKSHPACIHAGLTTN